MSDRQAPLGVFDSGVGGLTVVRELAWRLPSESVLYLADTAHVPYGGREPDELRGFAVGIARWLAEQGCKLVVMACNTTSAVAIEAVRAVVDLPVLGVIEGGAATAVEVLRRGAVGVAATTATVARGAYPAALRARRPDADVHQVACPAFVPLVEAGRLGTPDAYAAVCRYLEQLPLATLDALVLGCTHYPFLSPVIRMKVAEHTHLVDPAFETAKMVADTLSREGLLADGPGSTRLVATGPAASLERINAACFGGALPHPETIELWTGAAHATE